MDTNNTSSVWHVHACPEPECPAETWLVRRTPVFPDLWWIVDTANGALTTLPGVRPVCPCCGGDLYKLFERPLDQLVAFPTRVPQAA